DAPSNTNVQQTALQIALPTNTKNPIRPEFANKIGRDEKFDWITGQIEMENGNMMLYYSPPEVIDSFHGRIVLLPQGADLAQFKKGDMISVRGQLVQRQSPQGVIPIYRVTQANLIERPKN